MTSERRPPLSESEVIKKARWIWENGFTRITQHVKDELEEADATILDVEAVLQGQCQVTKSEYSPKYKTWHYQIEGPDSQGELLSIVVAINVKRSTMILITAF